MLIIVLGGGCGRGALREDVEEVREAGRQSVKEECREWGAARGKKPQCCRREGGAALGHVRRASEAPASGRRGTDTAYRGREFSVLAQARKDNSGGRRGVIGVLIGVLVACVYACVCCVAHATALRPSPGTCWDGLLFKGPLSFW